MGFIKKIKKFFGRKIITCTKCGRGVLVPHNTRVKGYVCDGCKYRETDGRLMGGGRAGIFG